MYSQETIGSDRRRTEVSEQKLATLRARPPRKKTLPEGFEGLMREHGAISWDWKAVR